MANFTKRAIKESLLKLLNERPSNKITVKDIVEDCGISRNSFYYHYEDIPSLIEEIIEEQTDKIIAEHPSLDSLEECFNIAVDFVAHNKQAVLYLYHSTNRDIFEHYLMKVCNYVAATYIETVFTDAPIRESDKTLIIRYYKCSCFGSIIDWLESGAKDSIDDIRASFHRLCELKKGMSAEMVRRSAEG